MIKYLIWDFDGVICDSMEVAFKCHNALAARYKTLPFIHSPDDYVSIFSGEFESSLEKYVKKCEVCRYFDLHRELLYRNKDQIKIFPGVIDFIKNFCCESVILTSASEKFLKEILLERFPDYEKFFKIIIGRERNGNKSDKLLWLCNTFRVSTQEILYIGDTLSDVFYCNMAKVPIICVGYGYSPASAFRDKEVLYLANTRKHLFRFLMSYCNNDKLCKRTT